jgi:hypothetical protein
MANTPIDPGKKLEGLPEVRRQRREHEADVVGPGPVEEATPAPAPGERAPSAPNAGNDNPPGSSSGGGGQG